MTTTATKKFLHQWLYSQSLYEVFIRHLPQAYEEIFRSLDMSLNRRATITALLLLAIRLDDEDGQTSQLSSLLKSVRKNPDFFQTQQNKFDLEYQEKQRIIKLEKRHLAAIKARDAKPPTDEQMKEIRQKFIARQERLKAKHQAQREKFLNTPERKAHKL